VHDGGDGQRPRGRLRDRGSAPRLRRAGQTARDDGGGHAVGRRRGRPRYPEGDEAPHDPAQLSRLPAQRGAAGGVRRREVAPPAVAGMYGKSAATFPERVVCLSTEHVEVCYALGAGERVVGVPGTARRPPEARDKPTVGGFTTFRADRILDLRPDLVLAFSDLQAEVSAELIRAGVPVFCTN